MTVTPAHEERDDVGTRDGAPVDEPLSLPPVVPDGEPDDEQLSLPPVVPDDEPLRADDVNDLQPPLGLPPVEPSGGDDDAPLPATTPGAPAALEREPALVVADPDDAPGPRVFHPDALGADEPVAPVDAGAAVVSDARAVSERLDTHASTEPDPSDAEPPSGWVVLGRALRPRLTRAQVLAGVLCAVLGFALVAQVRQSSGADLAGMRQGDLVRILDETTNRGDQLARESADLARERDDLLSGSDRRQAALDALRRSAETQGILTGRLPAEGPGVIVTLVEPDGFIKPITMLNMLEELRNAGAEAVQLNDQRVTASSSFTGSGGAVVLDGVALTAPYRWIAIGDPDIIAPALQIPGGAMAQVRNNGGRGTVESADKVEVDAIRDVPDPVYATPVPPAGD